MYDINITGNLYGKYSLQPYSTKQRGELNIIKRSPCIKFFLVSFVIPRFPGVWQIAEGEGLIDGWGRVRHTGNSRKIMRGTVQ